MLYVRRQGKVVKTRLASLFFYVGLPPLSPTLASYNPSRGSNSMQPLSLFSDSPWSRDRQKIQDETPGARHSCLEASLLTLLLVPVSLSQLRWIGLCENIIEDRLMFAKYYSYVTIFF
jgi:hypothetical protein